MTRSTVQKGSVDSGLGDGSISRKVVAAVADAEGVDPTDLRRPLFEAVDPDALDSFYSSARSNTAPTAVRISFYYHGYDVTVTEDGDVTVE